MFDKKSSKKNIDHEKIKAYAEESAKEQKPVNKKKEIISNIIYVAVVLAITIFIICFVGQRTKVDGDSMYPTLHDGDNLIVDKISYRFNDPERFDVIIFPYPQNEKVFYIKRVIGLPGETIQIDYDGNIYIDDEILEEDYGYEVMVNPGIAAEPITLGEDEYFVLGDNRNESNDSRAVDVGVIEEDDIVGRAWVRFFPFSDAGLVKNLP